ncbi:MAG TPA: phosphoglycerate kinase [Firmicutes bacterium]|nr:phosphoglycerate kinase [Bacillota bacterium]
MSGKKSVKDVDVSGKRVLLRVDFNTPISPAGEVADDTKIRESLPTINYLISKGAKVLVMSHLGRPKGKQDPKLSLAPAARRLEALLGRPVRMLPDCIGPEVEKAVESMKPGDLVLLENLRFHAGEEANDSSFARQLASLGDIFVNDAFGTAHRAHASTAGIARYLPAVMGFLMAKEVEVLSRLLSNPGRPFVAVLGGAKISDKIGLVRNLATLADVVLTGGGIANTLLVASGYGLGRSIVDKESLGEAKQMLTAAGQGKIQLPVDLVAARAVDSPEGVNVQVSKFPADMMALDIGRETCLRYAKEIGKAATVFWNGPMGVVESDAFAAGTLSVARAIAECKGITVVGGGDSVGALEKAGVTGKITHVSTGGGASLEFIEGRELPGIACLLDR